MAANTRTPRGKSLAIVLCAWLLSAAAASAQNAASLAFIQAPTNTPAGATITPAVTVAVKDAGGNVVTTDKSTVTLAIAPGSTGSGTLGGTVSVAAVDGVATFSNLSISAPGTYTLQATDTDNNVVLTPTISSSFTVSVQVKLGIVQQPTGAPAGSTIVPPVIVNVEDASGNVVTSDNSSMTVAIGPGSTGVGILGGTQTVVVSNGVATFSDLSISQAGTYTLQVTDGALTPATSVSFAISASVPNQPPVISAEIPASAEVFVDRFAPISLNLTSNGAGVDLTTVTITASRDGGVTTEPICTGLSAGATTYDASSNAAFKGTTYISGSATNYVFVFEPAAPFDYDETVTIRVTASDLAGNPMTLPVLNADGVQIDPYHFTVETRSFGFNDAQVDGGTAGNAFPAAATYAADDSVWVAWERDDVNGIGAIYLAKLTDDHTNFGAEIQVTTAADGDCHKPAIAITSGGKICVAYEVHGVLPSIGVVTATTTAPTTWTQVGPVAAISANVTLLTAPAVTFVNSTNTLCVVGVGPDLSGTQQIGVGKLVGAATTWTVTQVTTDVPDNKSSPAVAQDVNGLVYAVWENTVTKCLFGADASNWTAVHEVVNTANAGSPAIATEAGGTVLHFAWVAAGGTNPDILSAQTTAGWTGVPLTGASVLDTGGKGAPAAAAPRIAATGSAASGNAKVFVAWQDNRSRTPGDTDIEFAETNYAGTFGTNILVNVAAAGAGLLTNAAQSNPALAVTTDGTPYAAWTDLRKANTSHIFFVEATDPRACGAQPSPAGFPPTGGTELFTDPTNPHFTNVSVTALPGALDVTRNILAEELRNPVVATPGGSGIFADGSGLYLEIAGGSDETLGNQVTVTITLAPGATLPSPLVVYRLAPPASALGAWTWTTDLIQNVAYDSATRTLSFDTQHLSVFGVGTTSVSSRSSSGGGGCAMAPGGEPDVFILLLPLAALGVLVATRRTCRCAASASSSDRPRMRKSAPPRPR